MNIESILAAPTFNDLNKFEWLVMLTNITDHCRIDPARYEQLRELVKTWQVHLPAGMPIYTPDDPGIAIIQ